MNISKVLYTIGTILYIMGMLLLIPMGVSLYLTDEGNPYKHMSAKGLGEIDAFLVTIAGCLVVGFILRRIFSSSREEPLNVRDAFGIVVFAWLIMAMFGCLPFYLSGVCNSFTDAYFETMSGFSTTGASILTHIEILPHGLLFWRSFTQFLGGMGIIVLALAIMPNLGIGGYQLFKLDAPGGSTITKFKPRFSEIARTLWKVYIFLTLILVFSLWVGGMSLFDAICHSFTTLSTGGFSTRTDSIGAFNSLFISYIIIIFMFLAACNFQTLYQVSQGNFKVIYRDPQFKSYLTIILISIAFVTILLLSQRQPADTIEEKFRQAAFQVVSLSSCTGFTITDFSQFPRACLSLLLLLMMIGGCAGSTAGAIKQIRIIALAKIALRELTLLIRPSQVISVKVDDHVISQEELNNITAFFFLYLATLAIMAFTLTELGQSFLTAVSAVISTMGGVGPALGSVTANYSGLPAAGKWILIMCMLIGRLEIFGVWILFTPFIWRR
jgi:trk system potassium uptake protein TrkH